MSKFLAAVLGFLYVITALLFSKYITKINGVHIYTFICKNYQCFSFLCLSYANWVKNTFLGQFRQIQAPSVSLCTNTRCFFNSNGFDISLLHISQVTWEWHWSVWPFKSLWDPKYFRQGLQRKSWRFSCTLLMWLFIASLPANVLSHSLHSYLNQGLLLATGRSNPNGVYNWVVTFNSLSTVTAVKFAQYGKF